MRQDKTVSLRVLSAVVALVLVLSGCDADGPATSSTEAPDGKALFAGIVLGQGDVANAIPEVRDFTRLSNYVHSEAQRSAMRSFNKKMLAQIEAIDPQYFAQFGGAMRSGDRIQIKNALDEAGPTMLKAVSQMDEVRQLQAKLQEEPDLAEALSTRLQDVEGVNEASAADFEKMLNLLAAGKLAIDGVDNPYQENISTIAVITAVAAVVAAITVVAVQSYAAVLNVGGAVNVAAAVVAWVEVVAPEREVTMSKTLFGEQLVDSIALRYGPAS